MVMLKPTSLMVDPEDPDQAMVAELSTKANATRRERGRTQSWGYSPAPVIIQTFHFSMETYGDLPFWETLKWLIENMRF